MARLIFVDEGEQAKVAEAAARVAGDVGAVVTTKTPAVVEFVDWRPGEGSFARQGYVGIYQKFGDPELQILVDVAAESARRLFWTTVLLELLVIALVFALAPPISAWFAASVVLWAAFVVVALVYVGTWRLSGLLEREFLERLRQEVSRQGAVRTPMEIEEATARARVLAKVRIAQLKKDLRASRPSPSARDLFRFGRAATDEGASETERAAQDKDEEKRQRLLALKRELDEKRRDDARP
ncbi:MAG TPA: hypothetical protein VM681_04910 [Candidatus Thermoplasmatota archaeon]|nr:hypothetical protein [Candidatus Thermoplasmatota archaeon]